MGMILANSGFCAIEGYSANHFSLWGQSLQQQRAIGFRFSRKKVMGKAVEFWKESGPFTHIPT
jgi:hypothetical protein